MKPDPSRTAGMPERMAQVVLLVRAFEEADRDGRILTPYARIAATRRAIAVTGLSEYAGELSDAPSMRNGETVMRRARVLFDALERKVPVLRGVLNVAQLGASTAPVLVGLALVAGLLGNLLGPSRAVNLLSLPLLGMLAWNAAIYVAMAVRTARARGSAHTVSGPAWIQKLAGFFLKGALWRRLHGWKIARGGEHDAAGITAKATMRFVAMWNRVAGPLLASRVRRTLHVGAAAVLLGAVGGMYLRGFAFEYRATWESTWLDPPQAQLFLDTLLGPASAITGLAVPDVAPIRGPERSGEAATWIHLWAVTALWFVVAPRCALALLETWRIRRLASRLPVDLSDPYFARLFTAWRGASRIVRVVPYGFRPAAGATGGLRGLLHDYFGARADVRVAEPLEYGFDATVLHEPEAADGHHDVSWVVLFNLAQTPEPDVHGVLLEQLKEIVGDRDATLVVLIETSAYRRSAGARRADERLSAWRRVVRDAGLTAVDVEFDGGSGDRVLDAIGAGIWPEPEPIGSRR